MNEQINLKPELLALILRKDFWKKYKHLILKSMFQPPLDKLYSSVEGFHENYSEDLDKDKLWEIIKADHPTLTTAQKSDLAEYVQQIKEVTEWSEEFAHKILSNLWKVEVFTQIAKLGIDGAQGRIKDLEPLKELIDKHGADFVPKSAFVEVASGIDELLEQESNLPKWNFNLKPLQERIGGMGPGQFFQLMARPDCYTPDVEVLTEQGWCSFESLKLGVKVAQVTDSKSVEFVHPTDYIKNLHKGEVYNFTTLLGRLDITVTPGHDMVIEKAKGLQKVKAKDLKTGVYGLHTAVNTTTKFSGKFKYLTPKERLLIAFQADGSMPKAENNGVRCGARTARIGVKKQRKKDRIKEILDQSGFDYYLSGDNTSRPEYTVFYVKWPVSEHLSKEFDWINLSLRSPEWCREFIEELSYWDATRRSDTRFKYDTTNKFNAEMVQAIAVLGGMSVKYAEFVDDRKVCFSNIHSLSIRNYNPISGQTLLVNKQYYEGLVYCVTVPSGMLLLRSRGQTLISGNCGKTALIVSLVCAPGGFADQGALIHWFGNEEPMRRTRWRCISSATGMTKDELIANKDVAMATWNKIKRNVRTFDVPFGVPIESVTAKTRDERPNIIITDQLDKFSVRPLAAQFAAETDRIRLLYIKFRDNLKQHDALGFGVCQASADAEGKTIVTYDMAENSKTGKAAECDVFGALGRRPLTEGMLEESYTRWITISKSKLDSGWKGNFPCMLQPKISRFVE